MDGLTIWNPIETAVGRCASWRMGRLELWAERYEQEWHVLARTAPEPEDVPSFRFCKKAEKPQSSDWRHHLLSAGDWLHPGPAMMDRPLVVRPDRTLILMPGEKARFFISLPVWFRLMVARDLGGAAAKKLSEHPTLPMPNAWFGDPVSGELCYFSEARLYLDHNQIPDSPTQAVCPLWVSNDSDRELPFERICLHTDLLGIYRGEKRLWTNEVSVLFKGSDQTTQIQTSRAAPRFDGTARLVSDPRQTNENWHFKRTFDLLKIYTGF